MWAPGRQQREIENKMFNSRSYPKKSHYWTYEYEIGFQDTTRRDTYFTLEQVRIVVHSISVCECAHFVFQHLLVNAEVCVRVEVVVPGGHFLCSNILIRPYMTKE